MFTKINQFLRDENGQALVEFALVAPIFILVFLVGTLQFGIIINYENGVLASAREGARWGSITGDNNNNDNREDDIESIVDSKVEKYIEMMQWDTNKATISTVIDKDSSSGDDPNKADGGDPITVKVDYDVDLFFPWPDVFGGDEALTISHEVTTVLENI